MILNIITVQKNGNISTYDPELAGGIPSDKNRFVIGNIKEIENLEDIMNNKNFLAIQGEVHSGIKNCRDTCGYFKLCGGRSPGIKMYETGSFASTETKNCSLFRKVMADVIIDELTKISRSAATKINEFDQSRIL